MTLCSTSFTLKVLRSAVVQPGAMHWDGKLQSLCINDDDDDDEDDDNDDEEEKDGDNDDEEE